MDKKDIASVNLNASAVIFSAQIANESTNSDGFLVINSSNLGQPGAAFYPFDQERYSIHYSDGSIQSIKSSEVIIQSNQAFFYNCKPDETGVTVNVTATKAGLKSKTKTIVRSEELVIDKISTGIGTEEYDLEQNDYYGLRLDDEEVSLNVADVKQVLAVYESLDAATPILDKASIC